MLDAGAESTDASDHERVRLAAAQQAADLTALRARLFAAGDALQHGLMAEHDGPPPGEDAPQRERRSRSAGTSLKTRWPWLRCALPLLAHPPRVPVGRVAQRVMLL